MKQVLLPLILILSLAAAHGETGVMGLWMNPTGSTIQIYRCGANVCAKVFAISSKAPARIDAGNPDPALRKRSLCDLEIGKNFHLTSPDRAEDGRLYDPESGKTYSGSMTSDGNTLRLRGYIGISLFGRTEIWTRAREGITPCRS
ncbi:MAG: DUF2147 domain-containing protein [Silvibacterium sp.]